MAQFSDKVKANIRICEGGYNHVQGDHGGETNWGVADAIDGKLDGMLDWDHDGKPDVSIKNLTFEQAIEHVYIPQFWKPLRLDLLTDQHMAEAIMDTAINCGNRGAGKLVQRALGIPEGLVDGIIGPATLAKLNGVDPKAFTLTLSHIREAKYLAIIAKDPTQAKFKDGWIKRAQSFA